MKFFHTKISLYDCVDYHDRKEEIYEDLLIKNCNMLFVNSQVLFNIHAHKKNNAKLVVQGFNYRDFQSTKIKKTSKNKKPTIGFIGGINSRLDFKILIPLIKNNPQWNFEFWGPIQKLKDNKQINTWKQINILKKLKNTKFELSINKEELINAINTFDICIIPYDIKQKFNLNCYPMKIFEYFYLGKPVISTPIKELTLSKFKETIHIANTAKEFENKIKLIKKTKWPKEKVKFQKMIAVNNSWENKVNQVIKSI